MRHIYTWSGILVVVFFSVVGDILIARAMKQVGDIDRLRKFLSLLPSDRSAD